MKKTKKLIGIVYVRLVQDDIVQDDKDEYDRVTGRWNNEYP